MDNFEATIKARAEALRRRAMGAKASRADADAFAQLVYDAVTTCLWDVASENMEPLLCLTRTQLANNECPSVEPFHVLHYPVTRDFMRSVAAAHSATAHCQASGRVRDGPGRGSISLQELLCARFNSVWQHVCLCEIVFNTPKWRWRDASSVVVSSCGPLNCIDPNNMGLF
jgi:hypothetical protein